MASPSSNDPFFVHVCNDHSNSQQRVSLSPPGLDGAEDKSKVMLLGSGTIATIYSSTMDPVEPPAMSPSIFLDLPPTSHDEDAGVPASEQQQQVSLELISRMLMDDEEDMDGRSLCLHDHPALLHAQQSLARIISSSSASSGNGTTKSSLSGQDGTAPHLAASVTGNTGIRNAAGEPTGAEHCVSSMDLLNMAFLRGREEARKLLPREHRLVISPYPGEDRANGVFGGGANGVRDGRLGRELETDAGTGRASKLMATAGPAEEAGVQEMIARMMLNDCEMPREEMEHLRAAMADEAVMSNTREARRRRQQVDMRTLLVHCAQAVDDSHGARELLGQLKQHASATGDATQRLAHCFAAALEARLAGTGSLLHRSSLLANRATAAEFLKAYRLFIATCCFEKVAFAFANTAICRAAAGSTRLHVVDYGLHWGFQWPGLLRRLAARDGGPPEVTLTCVDLPEPGFRPARRIEETGHSLSEYAREVGVPFEFRAVAAARWDAAVRAEDLGVGPGTALAVNSLFKLETLADDSVVVDGPSPRDAVLAGIRRLRPAVFAHGVVNGFHGNSFLTRFREALFYYSAVFDLLDATMPRASEQRLVLERDVLGACALNVIACEGRDRTDRFDTYKLWQLRSRRAGLRQLPLDGEIVGATRGIARVQGYHRDFVIEEDDGWLLQGWKGRILYAHCAWVADEDFTP